MTTITTDTPVHLLPESCYVCGGPQSAHRDSDSSPHIFWSNARAQAEAAAYDARMTFRYPSGATTAEANYVATVRPA